MPRGEFKHRYWFFADTPNIARICRVIWKDLWWWADSYLLPLSHISGRMYSTIPSFQLSVWCEKYVAAWHYAVIWKQFLIANDRNRLRWVVLGLSEDGACKDLFKNFSKNSLKGDLSNATTVNPPFLSLVNTFYIGFSPALHLQCGDQNRRENSVPFFAGWRSVQGSLHIRLRPLWILQWSGRQLQLGSGE
jgi:hypothetical protein